MRSDPKLTPAFRYTTYSEVLSCFKNLVPIPTALSADNQYKLNIGQLKEEIQNMSLGVVIASNRESARVRRLLFLALNAPLPSARNPTGQQIEGEDLKSLVRLCKDKATIILDEFYRCTGTVAADMTRGLIRIMLQLVSVPG